MLDGVTGSGKTEVYKNIQSQITSKNLQTLIIVPEKNLIPGLFKSFKKLNLKVLEYHSSLTPKKKFDHWNLIQNCKVDVIIGPDFHFKEQIMELNQNFLDFYNLIDSCDNLAPYLNKSKYVFTAVGNTILEALIMESSVLVISNYFKDTEDLLKLSQIDKITVLGNFKNISLNYLVDFLSKNLDMPT